MNCPKCGSYITITKGAPYTSGIRKKNTYQITYYDCSNKNCDWSKEKKEKLT